MRIPFEIRTPGFFILIHEKLATLRIGGRDMSVKFPEQFTTALKGMYYYTPHKLCLWWVIIIRLLCRCAAVPAHEAYIAHTAHPVLGIHFGFKKGIRAASCLYPTPKVVVGILFSRCQCVRL